MERYSSLRDKEVINIYDGRCLGCIDDLCIDVCTGQISAIVLPMCGKAMSFWKQRDEIVIPWFKIVKIGDDVILVEWDAVSQKPEHTRR